MWPSSTTGRAEEQRGTGPTAARSRPAPQQPSAPRDVGSAGWWNLRGVSILDRAIWPDADGNCPAGPPRCVTSIAALRAAQEAGHATIDVPSNLYFYLTVHPETR